MAGGLLSLVSEGQQNIILNGNPSKSMWKGVYQKYTNFGLQHFRLEFEGAKTLRLNAACENLTNNRYRTFASGINAPGRNVIVSLRYKF